MKIVISPYSQKLRNGNRNAKNFPYWKDVIEALKDEYEIIQVGIDGEEKITDDFRVNLTMKEIIKLLNKSNLFISVDNFLPHLAHCYGHKGIVIFSISDPNIFGYPENENLLKDRKHLRQNQYDTWEGVAYNEDAFVSSEEVVETVKKITFVEV